MVVDFAWIGAAQKVAMGVIPVGKPRMEAMLKADLVEVATGAIVWSYKEPFGKNNVVSTRESIEANATAEVQKKFDKIVSEIGNALE